jgi:hypothetical protein
MNDELGSILKDAVVAFCPVFSLYSSGITEITKHFGLGGVLEDSQTDTS